MGLIVQKHVTIGQLIFDKKAMAFLTSWPTYPIFPYSFLEKTTWVIYSSKIISLLYTTWTEIVAKNPK